MTRASWLRDPLTLVRVADLQSRFGYRARAFEKYARAGAVLEERGFLRKAIAAYACALDLAKKETARWGGAQLDVALSLARVQAEEGLTREARLTLIESRERLIDDGRAESALAAQVALVNLDPEETPERVRLAHLLASAGAGGAAADEYATCVGQLFARGESHKALPVLERLLAQRADPVHARLAAELYLARGGDGDGVRALSALKLCMRDEAESEGTLRVLATALRLAGDAARAVKVDRAVARLRRGRSDGRVRPVLESGARATNPSSRSIPLLLVAR
jgi:tetratricopeptide (TPR) repeat protein